MQEHVDFALTAFGKLRKEISAAMVKHQLKLADRQCRMAELSQRVQDVVTALVTATLAVLLALRRLNEKVLQSMVLPDEQSPPAVVLHAPPLLLA